MTDKYKIDSQKITLHPKRVAQWLDAGNDWEKIKEVYPIYVEIAPVGACNHRCTFCSVDYIGYTTSRQDKDILLKTLDNMLKKGVKSVMFAGEGEPALWKPLPDVIVEAKKMGLDISMTTNLIPFTDSNIEKYVANCSWIKASINAGNSKEYKEIHQSKEADFEKALLNLKKCVDVKESNNYQCTIGAQILLLPENKGSVIDLAKRLKDIGANYLVVKPYTQSLYGISRKYDGLKYDEMMFLQEELSLISDNSFDVVFRENTMEKLNEEIQPYSKCLSTPNFLAYIMADGSVYSCGAHLKNENFLLGNINNSSFSEIWEGSLRRKNYLHVSELLSIKECRKNCRMDEVNRYLWELKNPGPHVNFI
jgi:GTP 3',8-cyclase